MFTFLCNCLAMFMILFSVDVTDSGQNLHQHKTGSHQCRMMKVDDQSASSARENQHTAMQHTGEREMGFSQTKTTHHFRLFADGGEIEVETKESNDNVSRDQIRNHLGHIAKAFARGDFSIPKAVHDQDPSGVSVLKRLYETIRYTYEETERGGRVRISSQSHEAVAAIHQFLKFQIAEHHTGDSLEVTEPEQRSKRE